MRRWTSPTPTAFARCRRASWSTAMATSRRWRSARARGTTARPTRSSRGCSRSDERVTRRCRRVHRGALLVPVAVRAAALSLLRVVHHRHVRRRPHHGPLTRRAPAGPDPRAGVRPGLLARLRRARRLVQCRGAVPARLSRVDPPHRWRAHRDLRALYHRAPEDRVLRAHSTVAAQREARRVSGLARGGYHLRHRLDPLRGTDPRGHPLARRYGRDGPARDRSPGRLLGGSRATVPDLGRGTRPLPGVLQALSPVHPRGRACGGRGPCRRRRSRLYELVRRAEQLGERVHPGLAPQAALAACAFTSAFPPPPRTSARASMLSSWRSPSTTRSSPRRGRA